MGFQSSALTLISRVALLFFVVLQTAETVVQQKCLGVCCSAQPPPRLLTLAGWPLPWSGRDEWQGRVAGTSGSVDDLSDCRCPSRDDSLQHRRPVSSNPQLCTQQPSCLTLTHVWHQHRQLHRSACNALGVLGYGGGEGPWTLRGSSFISHQIWSAVSPFL